MKLKADSMKRPIYVTYYGKEYSFQKTINLIIKKINSSIGYSISIEKMNKELDKNINFIFKMAKFVNVKPVKKDIIMAMEFDDIIEDGSNKWTELCKEHMHQAQDEKLGVASDNAQAMICGCKGCDKEADYFFDFFEK